MTAKSNPMIVELLGPDKARRSRGFEGGFGLLRRRDGEQIRGAGIGTVIDCVGDLPQGEGCDEWGLRIRDPRGEASVLISRKPSGDFFAVASSFDGRDRIGAADLSRDDAVRLASLYFSGNRGWMYAAKWERLNTESGDDGKAEADEDERVNGKVLLSSATILPLTGIIGALWAGENLALIPYFSGLAAMTAAVALFLALPFVGERARKVGRCA